MRVLGILLVAAVGGAGTMTIELAAVRLLAPWFGTSIVVWTNVIAIILLALAVGYLLGGVLSGRGSPLGTLAWTLLLAALGTAWLPWLAPTLAQSFLPAELALHEAADLVLWGSLAVSLLLFLPPAALLGTVAPLAVQSVQEARGGTAGFAGGAVLCTSTLGSLVGVFGTSHTFLPHLGVRGTFLLASGALLLAGFGAWLLWRGGGVKRVGAVWLLPLPLTSLLVALPRPLLSEGQTQLAAAESSYQSVRVVEDTSGPTPLRFLQVNEGFDSFQSVWQPEEGFLPEGFYYNLFALPLYWDEDRAGWRVTVLGLGAGTALRVLRGGAPQGVELDFTGVELDPEVVRLSRRFLELDPQAEVFDDLDARLALWGLKEPADLVVLDCYANQIEIPAHLCTLEFFRSIRKALDEGGWLAANLGGFGFDDPVVAAVARTCARAFDGEVLLVRVPLSRNFVLFARRGGPLPLEGDELRLPAPAPEADEGPRATLARLVAPLQLSGGWRLVAPPEPGLQDALTLTDDRCPIELLQLRSIAQGQRRRRSGS